MRRILTVLALTEMVDHMAFWDRPPRELIYEAMNVDVLTPPAGPSFAVTIPIFLASPRPAFIGLADRKAVKIQTRYLLT